MELRDRPPSLSQGSCPETLTRKVPLTQRTLETGFVQAGNTLQGVEGAVEPEGLPPLYWLLANIGSGGMAPSTLVAGQGIVVLNPREGHGGVALVDAMAPC